MDFRPSRTKLYLIDSRKAGKAKGNRNAFQTVS